MHRNIIVQLIYFPYSNPINNSHSAKELQYIDVNAMHINGFQFYTKYLPPFKYSTLVNKAAICGQ